MAAINIDTYERRGTKWVLDMDRNAELDISFDWTKYLAKVSDTLASVEFILDPKLTLIEQGNDTTHATVWLTPLDAPGGVLPVTCRITTNNTPPRRDDRTIYLRMVDK